MTYQEVPIEDLRTVGRISRYYTERVEGVAPLYRLPLKVVPSMSMLNFVVDELQLWQSANIVLCSDDDHKFSHPTKSPTPPILIERPQGSPDLRGGDCFSMNFRRACRECWSYLLVMVLDLHPYGR